MDITASAYEQLLVKRPLRKVVEEFFHPRQLDPLHGVPSEDIYRDYPALILRVPRRYQKRAFDHGENPRPGHSHIIVTLTHPRKDAKSFAFGPAEPIDFEKYQRWLDVAKLAVPVIWEHRAGLVTNEHFLLHDLSRVYLLETEKQYKAAITEIDRWRKNPPSYQVTGLTAPNCARFSFAAMNAASLQVPTHWHLTPWPHVVADDIERDARKPAQNPLIRNIPAALTVETFTQNQQRLCIPEPKRIVPVATRKPAIRKSIAAVPQVA